MRFILNFNPINLDNKFNFDNKIVKIGHLQPLPPIPKDYFLLVEGYGAGHGVGNESMGAKSMAERGQVFVKF